MVLPPRGATAAPGTAVQHIGAPGAGTGRQGYVGPVTYWVLKVVLTPIFLVLWRVKVEGRENIPKHGAGRAGRQPPVLLRFVLHPARRDAQGDVLGQGGVLRLVEDGVVLPGRRADPHPAERGQRQSSGRSRRPAATCSARAGSSGSTPRAPARSTATCTRVAPGVTRLSRECGVPVIPVGVDRHGRRAAGQLRNSCAPSRR